MDILFLALGIPAVLLIGFALIALVGCVFSGSSCGKPDDNNITDIEDI